MNAISKSHNDCRTSHIQARYMVLEHRLWQLERHKQTSIPSWEYRRVALPTLRDIGDAHQAELRET